jgi:hypothetical protein
MDKIQYNHNEGSIHRAIGVSDHFNEKVEVWIKERFVDARTKHDKLTQTVEEFLNDVGASTPAEYFYEGIQYKSANLSLEMARDRDLMDRISSEDFSKAISEALDPKKIAEYVDEFEEII